MLRVAPATIPRKQRERLEDATGPGEPNGFSRPPARIDSNRPIESLFPNRTLLVHLADRRRLNSLRAQSEEWIHLGRFARLQPGCQLLYVGERHCAPTDDKGALAGNLGHHGAKRSH